MSRLGSPSLSVANPDLVYLPNPNTGRPSTPHAGLGWLTVFLLYTITSSTPSAWAQSDRGTIPGTVSDPAGAVVPSATLSLINIGTAAAYDTVTTSTGNYTLPSVPAGRYVLKISAPGFAQYIQH